MIVKTKGKGNCQICGKFSYVIDIDPPGSEEIEIWGEWCKKHIPQWVARCLKEKEKENKND